MHPKMHLCAHFSSLTPSHLHLQLARLVCAWMTDYDPTKHVKKPHTHRNCLFANELVDSIIAMIENVSSDNHALLTIIAFMYLERFIKEVGMTHKAIVNVCIVSTMIAVKYWDDLMEGNNKYIADLTDTNLCHLNKLERIFLHRLNYNLSVSSKEISVFCYQLINQKH
eukprot:Phypoly_transcript_19360.p1 GENE.Phypoly_transcript_19360~~Phypoly_transcript_19360.p1  ORF type:complete len:168 (+),score=25.53 Phypoly_transcript_19360:170-673(+)